LRVLVDHVAVGGCAAGTSIQPEGVPERLALGNRGAHVIREGLDFSAERREYANRPDPDPLVPGLVPNRAGAQPSELFLAQFARLRSKRPQSAEQCLEHGRGERPRLGVARVAFNPQAQPVLVRGPSHATRVDDVTDRDEKILVASLAQRRSRKRDEHGPRLAFTTHEGGRRSRRSASR